MESNTPVDGNSLKTNLDQDHGSYKNINSANKIPTKIPRSNEAAVKLAPKKTNVKMGQIQQTTFATVEVSENPKNQEIAEELKMEQVITPVILDYGNTGCHLSSVQAGVTKFERFLFKINIPKENDRILRIGVMASFQKLSIILLIKCFKN